MTHNGLPDRRPTTPEPSASSNHRPNHSITRFFEVSASSFAAFIVYRYTKRKDRFDFTRQRWADQLAFNLAILNSNENLVSFEKLVYGKNVNISTGDVRQRFYLFIKINMVQHHYFMYKSGLIGRIEMIEEMNTIVQLISRNKSEIEYLLKERGYNSEFTKLFRSLLSNPEFTNQPKQPR